MSTVGNIVFSFIMMSVSFVLIVESIRDIATNATNPTTDGTTDFHVPAIVAVSIAFFVKFCLFCYCWGLREYPQVLPPPPAIVLREDWRDMRVGLTWDRCVFYGRIIGTICLSMDSVS
jgi:hypothetical protein